MATSRPLYPASKRVLDKGIAFTLVLGLLPVFAGVVGAMGVGMLAKRRDRGPFLYREPRISRGREFELLKFRTLRRDVLKQATDVESHARLLEGDEANLTWAGRRILKPWYLDELPQLFNVLRGDMSLVGPRPWPPSMVASQVAKGLDYRKEIVAGWTGPAQVQKGVTEPAGYAALDLAYVEECRKRRGLSLALLDLGILWQTVSVMAKGEGLRY